MRSMSSHLVRLGACAIAIGAQLGCGGSDKKVSSPEAKREAPLSDAPLSFEQSLAALPAEVTSVLGADVARIRTSAYYDRLGRPMVAQLLGASVLLGHPCVDLSEGLQSVLVAVGDDPNDPAKLFAIGTLAKSLDDLHACFASPPKGAAAVAVETDGHITRYKTGSEVVSARWLSKRTVLLVAREEAIARIGTPERNLTTGNAGFMALLAKTNTKAMVWGVAGDVARLGLAATVPHPVAPPRAAYGSCDLPGALAIHVGMGFDSEKTAVAAKQELQSQVDSARGQPLVGGFLSDVAVAQAGANVDVRVGLTQSEVESLLALAQMGGAALPVPGQ